MFFSTLRELLLIFSKNSNYDKNDINMIQHLFYQILMQIITVFCAWCHEKKLKLMKSKLMKIVISQFSAAVVFKKMNKK